MVSQRNTTAGLGRGRRTTAIRGCSLWGHWPAREAGCIPPKLTSRSPRTPQENDRGDEKIRQLIDTLDLRKDEAIERTFKGVAKQFRDIFAQVGRCTCEAVGCLGLVGCGFCGG